MRWFLVLVLVLGLAIGGAWATGLVSFGGSQPSGPGPTVAMAPSEPAPPAAAPAAATTAPSDTEPLRPANLPEARPVMQLQVVLDRLGFSPGVIDGREGMSLTTALRGLQRARGVPESGRVDEPTRALLAQWDRIPSTRTITIDPAFAGGPFSGPIPREPEDQARLAALGYSDLMEKLAERYHTTADTLRALNPAPGFAPRAGTQMVVPNIAGGPAGADAADDAGWRATLTSLGVAGEQPRAARLVVDKSDKVLRAFDSDDRLIAQFPATMGSAHDPLPLGRWEIRATAHNPPFHYNPALFWDADPGDRRLTLPPGPNGPVGVVWIDLSKEHYGIHGTPEPQTIGRTQSHGCIRLTNWDVARLAQMVRPGVVAVFQL
jgi:lipoprotein-anchoring transpeptidase ErfK/SrfK